MGVFISRNGLRADLTTIIQTKKDEVHSSSFLVLYLIHKFKGKPQSIAWV